MSSPYQCPRHNVALVARVLVSTRTATIAETKTIMSSTMTSDMKSIALSRALHKTKTNYFACPVAECNFKKPDKWKNRKRYDSQ
jgi:hypothetical protein